MSIKIQTEKIILKTGQAGRKVIDMVSRKELSKEYLEQPGSLHFREDLGLIAKRLDNNWFDVFLCVGDHITEYTFQIKISEIRKAGKMFEASIT